VNVLSVTAAVALLETRETSSAAALMREEYSSCWSEWAVVDNLGFRGPVAVRLPLSVLPGLVAGFLSGSANRSSAEPDHRAVVDDVGYVVAVPVPVSPTRM